MTQEFKNPLPIDWTPSSGIGSRIDPVTGNEADHKGVDIPVVVGTPVYAAMDGVVERVKVNPDGFGYYIAINHYDNSNPPNLLYVTKYGHLTPNSAEVKVGDKVEAGQEIGLSGNSGKSTGPHLHFEITKGGFLGKVIDPTQVTDRASQTEKAAEITNNFFSQVSSSIVSEIKDIISNFSQTKLAQFITDLFSIDSSGESKPVIISGQNSVGVEKSYIIQSGDTISKIASSLGTTTDKLIASNPWLTSDNRISSDGKNIIIKTGEKLSLPTSEIKNSIKLEDVILKNSSGSEIGNYTNFFLDQANQTLLTNTTLNSQWSVNNNPNSILNNTKIEFDFNSLVNSVIGIGNKNWDGISSIDNSLLNLEINTDKLQGFSTNTDQTQVGNVINGGDYSIGGPINNINGNGVVNVLPWLIAGDGYRPGSQELSGYQFFARDLGKEITSLNNNIFNTETAQSLWNSTNLNVNLSNLTNSSINATSFLNIDPVVLDLNGDGVKLTSYNDSQVTFDVDNDGKQERTGWVSNQDGILVEDVNQDGKINNITETISEYYNPNDGSVADADGKYSKDGLAALKKLDSNHDGKFNNQDSKWNDLKVWVDASGDGVTDAGELKTLTEAWVKEIFRFVSVAICLVVMLLMPIKSYAVTNEEADNNALEYVLKLQGINTPYHKNLWLEMKRLRKERSDPSYKGEKNLIKFLIQKYNLDPINKSEDQCQLMERISVYLVGTEGVSGTQRNCDKNGWCAQSYYLSVSDYADYDDHLADLSLISDNYGRFVGVWNLSKKNGYFKIIQNGDQKDPYLKGAIIPEATNTLNYVLYLGDKPQTNISYFKIDNCYIKEIHLKLDAVYIDPYYSKNYKPKNINN